MAWRTGAVLALILAAVAASPGAAWAQGRQNSTLTGTVTDDTGAVLPGVTVTASSPSLIGGAVTAVTDATGTYRFPAVLPGVYEVTATLDGFKTLRRTDIRVPVGETITADIQMQVAALSETVTVVGEVSTVDVKSSGSPVNVDTYLLQNLPTGRFQPDIINAVPGVSESSAFGGETDSNALLMDGVDVSDPEGGTPWAFFNYNWVQEVQIVALGANAEYGEFTGLAANSIIRSGSNRFSGLFEYWTVRPNWVGSNTSSLPEELREEFAPEKIESWFDSTAQVGGPIVRDKLWFFSGFQFLRENRIPAGADIARTEDNPRFITKINWAPSAAVRLEGFVEADKFDVTGRGAGRFRPAETTIVEPSPETNWNVRLTWTANASTLVEVRHGGYDGYFPLDPTSPNTTAGPPPRYDILTGFYSVNTPYYGRFDRRPITTTATVTRYVDR
ncbi:MAG TPA: carboxypeptidase-like regulatory domain-containing protein, partial [Vicinamibacterales bacterium]|nr:carboxypeptidase-like regulatory domain-containing protein [Vicinamibacterales bacterium]